MRHNGPSPTSRRERGIVRRRRERRRWTVVGVLAVACVATIAVLAVRGEGSEPTRTAGPTSIVASAAATHGTAGASSSRSPESVSDDGADASYLDLLDRADVTYERRDEIVRTGHDVCMFLGRGGTVTGARMLVTPYRRYSTDEGNAIVTAALSAYCPERRTAR